MNGKPVADYYDLLIANPAPRPGYAPRVNGPTTSWNHQGDFNFCADCEQNYHNCFWQYTGSPHDLQDMANETLPSP
jgi:hypothetical protein